MPEGGPRPGGPLSAVLFDVDDTLIDFAGAARAALSELVLAALGAGPGRDTTADQDLLEAAHRAWRQVSEREYSRFTLGELDFDQMRRSRMAAFLQAIDRPAALELDHELMEQRRHEAIFGHFRAFADVRPALDRLRRAGIAVHVLSNSDGPHQRAKLAAVGLDELAADGFYSGDLGVAKPDPQIFRLAAERLGRAPAELAYVGDRWDVDVLGSAAAGLAPVWLNRAGLARPDQAAAAGAVVQIATLDELVVDADGLHLG